ncbi:MAG: hypothetical protein NTY45_07190 [Elusimicrobia bacterium]|nr:hypothetical protein [Elusimicrobiota bacterium]
MKNKKNLVIAAILCFTGAAVSYAGQNQYLKGAAAFQLARSGEVSSEAVPQPEPPSQPDQGSFSIAGKISLVAAGDVAGSIIGKDSTQLNVYDGKNASLGQISRELFGFRHLATKFSDRPRMSLYFNDPEGNPVAYAYVNLAALANTAITVDESVAPFSKRIGSYHSDVLLDIAQSLSINLEDINSFFSVYSIYDLDGKYIARSIKSQDSTGFDLTVQRPGPMNANGKTDWIDVARIIVSPEWQIQIVDPEFVVAGQPGKLDPRLLVMMPAFKHFINNELLSGAN